MFFLTSRFSLWLKALFFRKLNTLISYLDRHLSSAGRYSAASSKFQLSIPSTVSKVPGTIDLLFYGPKSFHTGKLPATTNRPPGLPVVLNFHGGGFTIGAPNNDARWASAVIEAGAMMISVDYRLAPEYPHPIGIEDGVDALLWLWTHGKEYGLDPSRVILSGFSAGGNLSLTVALRLHAELERRKAIAETNKATIEKLAGIVSFYPSTNYTQSRDERRLSNKSPTRPARQAIPDLLFRLFDDSYLYPREDMNMSSPYLSPGLVPAETLLAALPDHVALFSCEWDQLHAEGEAFRARLRDLGKKVGGSVIMGVDHAWDKIPSFRRENPKRDAMYAEAAGELEKMLQRG